MLSADLKQQKINDNLQTLAMMLSAAILVSHYLAASILYSNQGLANDAKHCDLGVPPPGS
jgi:hypothetical protein